MANATIDITIKAFTPALWRFGLWVVPHLPAGIRQAGADFVLRHGWTFWRVESPHKLSGGWQRVYFKELNYGKPKTSG